MLSLFGYRVDGVVVNRIFPTEDADEWRAGWVTAQTEVLGQVSESFAGLPLWRSVYRTGEPVGVTALCELAREVYADADPLVVSEGNGPFRITRTTGGAVVHLALPHVTRDEVDLARHGDELVVSVASYRRLLTLPPGLGRHQIAGARLAGGELQVRFKEGAS
jgi:arsenite-transporting ATPase